MHRPRALTLVVVLLALVGLSVALGLLARQFDTSDLDTVRDVAQDRTHIATVIAHAVSWLGRTAVLAVVALAIELAAARRTHRRPDPTLLLVVAGAWALQTLAKLSTDRPRPPVPHLEHVTSSSFPSGHAVQIAALAAALCVSYAGSAHARPVRVGFWIAALGVVVAVAASRVYLGVHYPTDVIAGALLGTTWGVIAAGRVTASPGPDGAQPRIPVCPSE